MEYTHIKPLSLTELAGQYEMSIDVIKKWIEPFEKEIGVKRGRYYNPRQVRIIYQRLGPPDSYINNG